MVIGLLEIIRGLVGLEKLNAQIRAAVVFASDRIWCDWHTAIVWSSFRAVWLVQGSLRGSAELGGVVVD